MARNKNRDRSRDRKKQQDRPAADRGTEPSRSTSIDSGAERIQSQMTSSDDSPKGRQKRFGHN